MTIARRGVTLVELIVALTLVALMAGVATVTMRAAAKAGSADSAAARVDAAIAALRDSALRVGVPVSDTLRVAAGVAAAELTAFPDGSVVGDSTLPVERTTGRTPRRAR
jgi:prepilin-type N-terminal cleavage/methylation domain-containing protein